MGQYYKPVNIESFQWVYSHDYGSGLKLMEHSWVGNEFVGAVMKLLAKGGAWHKKPIVWCGDYYNEDGEEDYYDKAAEESKITPKESFLRKEQLRSFLVNHTKKEYVDYSKLRADSDGWIVNPLPLLTALGNGRGGGDYGENSPDAEKVGLWARDCLSVESEVPQGFSELKVKFQE